MSVVSSFMSFFVKIITFGALYTQQNKYFEFWFSPPKNFMFIVFKVLAMF